MICEANWLHILCNVNLNFLVKRLILLLVKPKYLIVYLPEAIITTTPCKVWAHSRDLLLLAPSANLGEQFSHYGIYRTTWRAGLTFKQLPTFNELILPTSRLLQPAVQYFKSLQYSLVLIVKPLWDISYSVYFSTLICSKVVSISIWSRVLHYISCSQLNHDRPDESRYIRYIYSKYISKYIYILFM